MKQNQTENLGGGVIADFYPDIGIKLKNESEKDEIFISPEALGNLINFAHKISEEEGHNEYRLGMMLLQLK